MTVAARKPPKPWIRPARTQCGNCNRRMPKAKKVFKGIAFCETCYAREFHRVPCRRCKEPCRKHHSDYEALCRKCTVIERRCLRCDRPVPHAALMIKDRPVCPSCRRHFKPGSTKKPVGHATCRVCRKYRFAVSQDEKGRPICKACDASDRTQEVKARDEAYWRESLKKRAKLVSAALAQEWAVDLWNEFVEAEAKDAGPKNVALKIQHYIDFFIRLDSKFTAKESVDGASLCLAFTGDELRRYWKVVRFLEAVGIEIPTQKQKTDAIESARIDRMLTSAKTSPHHGLLCDFVAMVRRDIASGKGTLPTLRMGLRPSIDLIEVAGTQPLSQAHLDRYLRDHRGQRAALSRFVGYLNGLGISLTLPSKARATQLAPELAEDPTPRWLEAAGSGVRGESAAAVIALLMHGLGISQAALLGSERSMVSVAGRKTMLLVDGYELELDSRLGQAMNAFLELRDAEFGADGLLFPGRHKTQSISPAGLAYHLSRWGTPASAIAAPARNALKSQAQASPASDT